MDSELMEYLEPWLAVAPDDAMRLQNELADEVGRRHPLHGREMRALARRQDCHDVLFVSLKEPRVVAVVHLTWSRRREADPQWPGVTFFDSIQDWVERGMMVDHRDFV